MAEVVLPEALRGAEPVRSIRTPARLDYTFTAGMAATRFLRAVAEKQIIGVRCPACSKVYVPMRTACPTCGEDMTEEVPLPAKGTVTSFCVVNVQFYGQVMELPYVGALILLDGSDIPLMHLIQEVPAAEVHAGMRVEGVWVDDDDLGPTLESVKYFRPTGEPDAPWETYKDNV